MFFCWARLWEPWLSPGRNRIDMSDADYAMMSTRGQVAVMRRHAAEFLSLWGIRNVSLKLVNHGFNTTFRVDWGGRSAALRINVNSIRSEAQIRAETAWTSALADWGQVPVPRPIPMRDGGHVATRDWEGTPHPLRAVLYEWLLGHNFSKGITPAVCRSLGRATRLLHEHGRGFELPDGAELAQFDDPTFGANVLIGHDYVQDQGVLERTRQANLPILARLNEKQCMPVHFDLHFWNLRQTSNGLGVLDFDDCLMGKPVLDVMVTLYYLRRVEAFHGRQLEAAYWDGLGLEVEDLEVSSQELETLIAGRAYLLANDFLRNVTPDVVAMGPKYLRATEIRLREFEKTGVFRPFNVEES